MRDAIWYGALGAMIFTIFILGVLSAAGLGAMLASPDCLKPAIGTLFRDRLTGEPVIVASQSGSCSTIVIRRADGTRERLNLRELSL